MLSIIVSKWENSSKHGIHREYYLKAKEFRSTKSIGLFINFWLRSLNLIKLAVLMFMVLLRATQAAVGEVEFWEITRKSCWLLKLSENFRQYDIQVQSEYNTLIDVLLQEISPPLSIEVTMAKIWHVFEYENLFWSYSQGGQQSIWLSSNFWMLASP